MNIDEFKALLKPVTDLVSNSQVDSALAAELNRRFPPGGETFDAIEKACHEAIADGWMCAQGTEGGPRYGRVIEPCPETGGLSVDVVDLTDWVGSHHRHPTGEVCMIMPITTNARFDGVPRGWSIYEPSSAHHPTVTDGQALILYMLPDGQIEYSSR
ncbi:MAG: DUF4863 family protein [Desulfobacterales bacterium]|nr:MAG: DUF4863 family protein [Desulfobacterales bacterium]